MSETCKRFAENKWFKHSITAAIIVAAILIGLQTSPTIIRQYGFLLTLLNDFVLGIFLIEVIIKIVAEGRRPWNYFKDPWNIFDFTIVLFSLLEPVLPGNTSFLPVLRLFRVFRVLRIVTVIPELRLLVETLLRSMSSIIYVGLFLVLLFYIFGTMGVFLFRGNDPIHFGNLPIAILTLFRIVTLEDWTDVMYINMFGCDKYGYDGNEALCTNPHEMPLGSALYFVSFVAIGTMIILNLFIGVIMNSMDQVNEEKELEDIAKRREADQTTIGDEMHVLHDKLQEITRQLDLIGLRLDREINNKQNESDNGLN